MDAGMLEQVLWHIHNRFDHEVMRVKGCKIDGGELPASVHVPDGAWYWIDGSLFNDGLHQHPYESLTDETFDGTVTTCAIPKALVALADEIEAWVADYDEGRTKALRSPYQSESFGGYSYTTKGDGASNSASGGLSGLSGWQLEFASRLNPWRKIS